MCRHIFVFPSPPPLSSRSQSIPGGITALFHGNCLTWAGVSDSRADCQTEQAGVQLTVSANVKWQGLWSRGERIEDHSTFQSRSRSYPVNHRLNTNQGKLLDPILIVFLQDKLKCIQVPLHFIARNYGRNVTWHIKGGLLCSFPG